MRRTAVIDMGSNSWRLVVYDWEPGEAWRRTDQIREMVRIGERLGDGLTLKPEPIERGLRAADVFASFCREAGIDDIVAVATSAIRDARNRDDLLVPLRERTGIEPRVLSGEEEARYGYLAIVDSTDLADGAGLDVGGGSVQVMRMERRELVEAVSHPLGAVRMTEAFLRGENTSRDQLDALALHVRDTVGGVPGERIAGIGGTIRNLAAAAKRSEGDGGGGVQGYPLTREALAALVASLAALPASERARIPGIKRGRADVILAGAVVVAAVMDAGGFETLAVSEAGLREGVFLERYLRASDPAVPERGST